MDVFANGLTWDLVALLTSGRKFWGCDRRIISGPLSGSEAITRVIPLIEWKIISMSYLLFLEYQYLKINVWYSEKANNIFNIVIFSNY